MEIEAAGIVSGNHHHSRTVSECWDLYRNFGGQGERPTRIWEQYIEPDFGRLRPDEIDPVRVQSFIEARSRFVKYSTIRREIGVLVSCLNWARRHHYIENVPHIERPAAPRVPKRILSRSEIDRLLAVAKDPLLAFLQISLGTGQRRDAIRLLTWGQVQGDLIDYEVATPTKGKGRSVVPVNAMVRAALTRMGGGAPGDYVIRVNGAAVPKSTLQSQWVMACKRAGIQKAHIHCIRHTVARFVLDAGGSMEEVQRILGHASIATTQRHYVEWSPGYLDKATKSLSF